MLWTNSPRPKRKETGAAHRWLVLRINHRHRFGVPLVFQSRKTFVPTRSIGPSPSPRVVDNKLVLSLVPGHHRQKVPRVDEADLNRVTLLQVSDSVIDG